MPKRCLCGHDIGPIDEITFQLNGKCKVCHDRDTAISIEQNQWILDQVNSTFEEKMAAARRLSEIKDIESQIEKASQFAQKFIRAKDEYEL